MISGFNTDIEFQGTVYHVQTEDKGLKARKIISLVFDRGTILASKRTSYDELIKGEYSEKELTESLSKQHKLICAAVQAGRINELKEMTAKVAALAVKENVKVEAVAVVNDHVKSPPFIPGIIAEDKSPPVSSESIKFEIVEDEPPVLDSPSVFDTPYEITEEQLVFDGVYLIEDEEIFPAELVEVVSELSGKERSEHNKLSLELLGETKFKGGDRRTVNIMICRGTGRKVVTDAQIMIKVLGSSFRPVIFHAKSDSNGLARVHLQLPNFQAGRAAILIRAMTDGEEIELRRTVTPN